MPARERPYNDLLPSEDDVAAHAFFAVLDRYYDQPAPLATRAAGKALLRDRVLSRPTARVRFARRLSTVFAALVLVLGGGGAYLWHTTATPTVSAQEILHHALMALPPLNAQVIHTVTASESSTWSIGKGTTVTPQQTETWIDVNAQGDVARISKTTTDRTGIAQSQVETTTVSGRTFAVYLSQGHLVMHQFTPAASCGSAVSSQTPVTAVISGYDVLILATHHTNANLRVAASQHLDGRLVDVVVDSTAPDDIVPAPGTSQPTPYRQETYYYIDAHTYVFRGMDVFHITPNGKTTRTDYLRVLTFEVVTPSAVPAHSFDLHAPAGVQTMYQTSLPQPCPLSVRQAVASAPLSSPLLGGHPFGLNLNAITEEKASGLMTETVTLCSGFGDNFTFTGSFVDYAYQSRDPSNPVTEDFCVAVATGPAANVALPHIIDMRPLEKRATPLSTVLPMPMPSTLHLTIAGQVVDAQYYRATGQGNRGSNLLWYTWHGRTIAVTGHQMDQGTFLTVLGGLVDVRTHPALAAALQRRLDALKQASK